MNQIDLQGRVAVVTGGARGIGWAIAQRFLQSGAKVVLWDIDAQELKQASKTLASVVGPVAAASVVHSQCVELTDDAAVARATHDTLAATGRIDILVNNAGITGGNGLTWELDTEVWRRVVDVNLIGPYLT